MHSTAPVTVFTPPSWVRKKAGPRKPICSAGPGDARVRVQGHVVWRPAGAPIKGQGAGSCRVAHSGRARSGSKAARSSAALRPAWRARRARAPPQAHRRLPLPACPTTGSRAPTTHRLHELTHKGDAGAALHERVGDPAAHVGGHGHCDPGQHLQLREWHARANQQAGQPSTQMQPDRPGSTQESQPTTHP